MGRRRELSEEAPKERGLHTSALVSASELAKLGYCEMQVYLDHRHGEQVTPAQLQARARGNRAHEGFLLESKRLAAASGKKGRCFIATLALGPGKETLALRQFRDLYLRPHPWGRSFIVLYYRASPLVCSAMEGHPFLVGPARLVLGPLARLAALLVERKLQEGSRYGR